MTLALALAHVAAAAAPVVEMLPDGAAFGTVERIVDAPAAQVLAIVNGCEEYVAWFPHVADTVARSRTRCAGRMNVPFLSDRTWEIDTAVTPTGAGWTASFAYVAGSGDIEAMHGRWVITPVDAGRTLVRYEATVDLGVALPGLLVRWVTWTALPGILDGLERAAADGLGAPLVASLEHVTTW